MLDAVGRCWTLIYLGIRYWTRLDARLFKRSDSFLYSIGRDWTRHLAIVLKQGRISGRSLLEDIHSAEIAIFIKHLSSIGIRRTLGHCLQGRSALSADIQQRIYRSSYSLQRISLLCTLLQREEFWYYKFILRFTMDGLEFKFPVPPVQWQDEIIFAMILFLPKNV